MRHNICYLYGRVTTNGVKSKKDENGIVNYAAFRLDTVRSKTRTVEDRMTGTVHEHIIIIARDAHTAEIAAALEPNDIVFIKGAATTKKIKKTTKCPECGKENQEYFGQTLFVTPIFIEKMKSYDSKIEAIRDVASHNEISNSVNVVGTLVKDPKFYKTKRGVEITQYPLAIDRKYMVPQDDPSIKTDWPFVKSYGQQARDDKIFIHYQSDVMIDGYLQKRGVMRHAVCPFCGKKYDWKDFTMEIVPYEHSIEYLNNFKSREEVESETHQTVEELENDLYMKGRNDKLDDDTNTLDIVSDENSDK